MIMKSTLSFFYLLLDFSFAFFALSSLFLLIHLSILLSSHLIPLKFLKSVLLNYFIPIILLVFLLQHLIPECLLKPFLGLLLLRNLAFTWFWRRRSILSCKLFLTLLIFAYFLSIFSFFLTYLFIISAVFMIHHTYTLIFFHLSLPLFLCIF